MQVIPEPVLVCPIRDVERTDSKVGQKKHLLPYGTEPEGKDSSLLLPRNAQYQKGKHHAGKGIEEASCHIPDHILFFQAHPCLHKKVRPVFHSDCTPLRLYSLAASVTAHG